MNILIVGANFYNKGAELMLKTVEQELSRRLGHVNLYLSPMIVRKEDLESSKFKLLDYPLRHVGDTRYFSLFLHFGFILKFLRTTYRGDVSINKIDVVIDISGFAFGDQWGYKPIKNVSSMISFFKKKEAKYIFLPQAFGPFATDRSKSFIKKVIEKCDLIISRDNVSKSYLKLISESNKIKIYPDITFSYKPSKKGFKLDLNNDGFICIVPNVRMLDQGSAVWKDGEYLKYLQLCLSKVMAESNFNIYIMVHDNDNTNGDMRIATQLQSLFESSKRIEILNEKNPDTLKLILGGSLFVIGSRFHALVSTLSQGTPCIAIGWSHKYKMLFDEYNLADFAFLKPKEEQYNECLDYLLSEDKRKKLRDGIVGTNEQISEKNNEMWQLVNDKIYDKS